MTESYQPDLEDVSRLLRRGYKLIVVPSAMRPFDYDFGPAVLRLIEATTLKSEVEAEGRKVTPTGSPLPPSDFHDVAGANVP